MPTFSAMSFSLQNAFDNPSIGVDGALKALVEMGLTTIEVDTWHLVNDKVSHTWLTRSFQRVFGHQQFDLFMSALNRHGIIPIMLSIDSTVLMWHHGAKFFDHVKDWANIAHGLGIPTIRIFIGWNPILASKKQQFPRVVKMVKPIVKLAEDLGLTVIYENALGVSTDPDFVLMLAKEINSPAFSFLLDFGNFRPKSAVYDNILKLKGTISAVHAKAYAFNGEGEEKRLDFAQIIKNLEQIGFDGRYIIEYFAKTDQVEGTRKTLDLVKRCLSRNEKLPTA